MRRRDFLVSLAGASAIAAVRPELTAIAQETITPVARKGRIKQAVTPGVFRGMPFEETCRHAARLGIKGYDLIAPDNWPTLRKYGLVPTMWNGPAGSIPQSINRTENHARIETSLRAAIDQASAGQVPNIITFSGNRAGMDDRVGADNCVDFLNKIKAQAEDKNVTICIELLNSKVNHRDYMFDHMPWGVDVIKRVNSPRVKVLYDIYHAQIMDGDIVRTIKENIQWIAHFHTGGNPGRHDIDESQELNYRFVCQAIAETGFTGFLTHEYSPDTGHDPIATLEKAIGICDV